MSLKINYRKVNPSPEISDQIENEVMAVSRFLLPGGRWSIELSRKKSVCHLLIKVSSPLGYFQAQGEADDFSSAISQSFAKLIAQIKRRKDSFDGKKVKSIKELRVSPHETNDILYLPVEDLPLPQPQKKVS